MRYIIIFFFLLPEIIYANENPLSDRKVTCEEMEKYPEMVFRLDDLGSGYGSPNDVNYYCPKSLSQLDFLQSILSQASNIRSPSGLPQICTGSIVHAQWRYYHFYLARLGYLPQSALISTRKTRGMEYFEEWSYHSVHNRRIYNAYAAELERVKPLLMDWYIKNHSVGGDTAQQYVENALRAISNYGFGSYYYYWKPEELVPFTKQAINGNHDHFLDLLSSSSDKQKINSLRRFLVHQPSKKLLSKLVNSILVKNKKLRSESPISLAVYNSEYVRLLSEGGFDPNHQNSFGKTPLYYAIQFNRHKSVEVLLDNGANINHSYQLENNNKWNCSGIKQWGRTPLMHASQHSDIKMIQLLLNRGASLLDKDILGLTAMDYAKRNGKGENEKFLRLELEKLYLTGQSAQAD